MDALNIINAVVVSLGIPTIIVTAIYIGRKLQILDDLKGIRGRFDIVESRVNDLWADRLAPAHSPRQLNEKGKKILEESGIKKIIDEKRDDLFRIIKEKNPASAYDAEVVIGSVLETLPKSLFSIFFPTPFCAILATKPSDFLGVGTATPRQSSDFSLKISSKWLWKKDTKQALSITPISYKI